MIDLRAYRSRLRRLAEKVAGLREATEERKARRDRWAEAIGAVALPPAAALKASLETAARPTLDALTASLDALEAELAPTEGAVGALRSLADALDDLPDGVVRANYAGPYEEGLAALEERLADGSPLMTAVDAMLACVEPAETAAEEEIARRRFAAAEQETRRREAAERAEAERRCRAAVESADAALATLAGLAGQGEQDARP